MILLGMSPSGRNGPDRSIITPKKNIDGLSFFSKIAFPSPHTRANHHHIGNDHVTGHREALNTYLRRYPWEQYEY